MRDTIAQICKLKTNMKSFRCLYLQGNLKLLPIFSLSNSHLDSMDIDILNVIF